MNIKRIFFLLICFFPFFLHAEKRITTIIMSHSQSVNAARELAGWENFVNIDEAHESYGVFAINPAFNLSFRPDRIAQCFFGDSILDYKTTFTVAGSRTDRFDAHWLADYFGLPPDFESYITIYPQVSNTILNLDIFAGLNKGIPGLYFRVHAPLVHTRWKFGLCETLLSTGSLCYDPGYFTSTVIDRSDLVDSFKTFITGRDTPTSDTLLFHRLEHSKMSCKQEKLTGLSDIQLALGWNLFQKKKYHLGANVRVSIPTGNRPTGDLLFEPFIGNGHHWEIGGGLSTHLVVWQDKNSEAYAGLYFDLNITHLFPSYQCRSFDLYSGHNSRYMLAQRMAPDIQNNLRGIIDGEHITPSLQYQNEVTTVANLTTLPVKVNVKLQADLALILNFTNEQNSWGFGYGFWGRSSEEITICGQTPFDNSYWALKGDAHLFGFEDTTDIPIPLSATQSQATIESGKNFPRSGATQPRDVTTGKKNPHIDNPAPAVSDSSNSGVFLAVQTEPGGSNQINTSIEPIMFTTQDIDIESARTKGIAHKIFSHYTRTLAIYSTLPYIGFGGEIEFGPQAYCPRAICLKEPGCMNTALSFWGIWVKGGVAF